ncbi:MAG: tyrosine-type recombinase/integrase [Bacteroidales bacterium]|nr:tyrosine-type recombinase/integrase [Bacteroidales bacterium]
MCIFAIVKIDEAIQRFTDYVSSERRLAEGTVRYYISEVERFGRYLYSQDIHLIEEISAQDVRSWQMSLMEEGEAAGTVTKQIAALRAWFKFLRKKGYTDTDIMVKITPPKRAKRLPIFFREDEVEQIYDDIYPNDYDGELDKLVLRMLYETGMRRSELANVTLGNINLDELTIKVRGKRNKERIIPIEDELAHNISRFIALRNTMVEELKAKKPTVANTDRLLVNSKGRVVSDGMIYLIVEKYMAPRSNAERTSPHVFRHTFATHMLNEGANIDAIKELLGHSDLAATEVYTHVTREHLKDTYKHAHPRATKK